MKTVLLSILIQLPLFAFCLPDTLKINKDNFHISLLPHSHVIIDQNDQSATEILGRFRKEKKQVIENPFAGYVKGTLWANFQIQNTTSVETEYLIVVDNPHIDSLFLYEVNDQPKRLYLAGDKLSFYARPIDHRNYHFPIKLKPNEVKTFLLHADKRGSALYIPIELYTTNAMAHEDHIATISIGVYFGVIGFFSICALLAYILFPEKIYLFFFLNAIGLVAYGAASLGLAFQYVYPSQPDLNSIVHFSLSILMFTTWSLFSVEFLNLKTRSPLLVKVILFTNLLILAYIFGGFFLESVIIKFSSFLIAFLFLLLLLVNTLIYISGIKLLKTNSSDGIFFLLAFSAIYMTGAVNILRSFGINLFPFSINPILAGSGLEVLFVATALALRTKKIFEERLLFKRKIAVQDKELLRAYVDGVEKERNRLSRELHDDIGSRLGTLKRFFSKNTSENKMLETHIDSLYEDVRKMSHQLSPPLLKMIGLKEMIFKLAAEAEALANVKMNVQFYDLPELINDEKTYHIYRIVQEAIQNIIKHSMATESDLQFISYEGFIVITIDDNGKGFNVSQQHEGIGIKNIRARSESLGGELTINSQETRGTSLIIKIPLAIELIE